MSPPRRQRAPVSTDCGHGYVPNACSVALGPMKVCQACARSLWTANDVDTKVIITVLLPLAAVPAPGGQITVRRDSTGAFVYAPPAP